MHYLEDRASWMKARKMNFDQAHIANYNGSDFK